MSESPHLAEDPAPPAAPVERTFGVPRRFDLALLMIISLLAAISFAIASACQVEPVVTAVLAIFFAFVGLLQAVLFQGQRPRAASLVAGLVLAAVQLIWLTADVIRRTGRVPDVPDLLIDLPEIIPAVCALVALWCTSTYIAGALIGGLFLVTHHWRCFLARRHSAQRPAADD